MDDTFQAVGRLLIQALPTFFIVLILFAYLRAVFFRPLDRVLAERTQATVGARQRAAEALDRANAKAAAYEEQIRTARNEIYKEQEEQRKLWREQHSAQVEEARRTSDATIVEARAELATAAAEARQSLSTQTLGLASQITEAILDRKGL